ncbi:GntR family transcriptional regulator [Marinivivus vitaminiproducens]|uniref:GntR family transcriptional regulator n=1 Tax=Marinivivus vitaminiproducens TaxID=3035935 RepID=UPI0027A02C77|nr:GntR family transcriptional regulator [Geminicoccaceae bacterium SCSIO 64248]
MPRQDVIDVPTDIVAGSFDEGGSQDSATLGRQVHQAIEERLLTGRLLPGTKVSLRGLAQDLGTSMQPVREAVSRLVAASALEFTSSRVIRVTTLDWRQASDLWAMRLLLEGEACAQFAERRVRDEAERLFANTERMRALDFGADLHHTMSAILDWNLDLARGASSPLLVDTIMTLRVRFAPTIALALSRPEPFDPVFRDFTLHIQDELIMAIVAGDAASARHLRCADLRSFQRYLFERLNWPNAI